MVLCILIPLYTICIIAHCTPMCYVFVQDKILLILNSWFLQQIFLINLFYFLPSTCLIWSAERTSLRGISLVSLSVQFGNCTLIRHMWFWIQCGFHILSQQCQETLQLLQPLLLVANKCEVFNAHESWQELILCFDRI